MSCIWKLEKYLLHAWCLLYLSNKYPKKKKTRCERRWGTMRKVIIFTRGHVDIHIERERHVVQKGTQNLYFAQNLQVLESFRFPSLAQLFVTRESSAQRLLTGYQLPASALPQQNRCLEPLP
jgi:hypothetical protein